MPPADGQRAYQPRRPARRAAPAHRPSRDFRGSRRGASGTVAPRAPPPASAVRGGGRGPGGCGPIRGPPRCPPRAPIPESTGLARRFPVRCGRSRASTTAAGAPGRRQPAPDRRRPARERTPRRPGTALRGRGHSLDHRQRRRALGFPAPPRPAAVYRMLRIGPAPRRGPRLAPRRQGGDRSRGGKTSFAWRRRARVPRLDGHGSARLAVTTSSSALRRRADPRPPCCCWCPLLLGRFGFVPGAWLGYPDRPMATHLLGRPAHPSLSAPDRRGREVHSVGGTVRHGGVPTAEPPPSPGAASRLQALQRCCWWWPSTGCGRTRPPPSAPTGGRRCWPGTAR